MGGMQHVKEVRQVYIGFRWRKLKETDHLEDLGVDGRIIIKLSFNI